MKFNPITQQLFTDSGILVKVLHCPLFKRWDDLTDIALSQNKLCDSCNHNVLETSLLKEDELLNLLQVNPNTCLKVYLNQTNITITYHNE